MAKRVEGDDQFNPPEAEKLKSTTVAIAANNGTTTDHTPATALIDVPPQRSSPWYEESIRGRTTSEIDRDHHDQRQCGGTEQCLRHGNEQKEGDRQDDAPCVTAAPTSTTQACLIMKAATVETETAVVHQLAEYGQQFNDEQWAKTVC